MICKTFRIEFKNPKKSKHFETLLKGFSAARLLDAKHADTDYWNKKALIFANEKIEMREMTNQELFNYLDSIEQVNYDATKQASIQRKLIVRLKKTTKT